MARRHGVPVWPLSFPVAQVESLEPKCPCGSLPGQGLQTLTCHITLPPAQSPASVHLPAPSGDWNERRCYLTHIPPPCAAPTQASFLRTLPKRSLPSPWPREDGSSSPAPDTCTLYRGVWGLHHLAHVHSHCAAHSSPSNALHAENRPRPQHTNQASCPVST